jgi:hypothetical protein
MAVPDLPGKTQNLLPVCATSPSASRWGSIKPTETRRSTSTMGHEQRPIARPRDFLDDYQERTLGVLVIDDCESAARGAI